MGNYLNLAFRGKSIILEFMESLPFEIPQSLASYVEQYEAEPQSAMDRLDKQLHRRGSDAVGHFLMSWFHFNAGELDKAIAYALKAKTFAPGSPFLEYLTLFPDSSREI